MGHQNMDIHWLAIINSFVLMLLILSLFLLIIIRVVRSDLSRYLQIPDEELSGVDEETGWKLLHADVFRAPRQRLLFCSAVGSGAQIFSMVMMIVLVGCVGVFYQRGAVASVGVISYMITSAVGGYKSSQLYHKLGGEKWAWNIFATALMFVGPAFHIWSFLNTVAIIYGSTAAFPFPTILLMFTMWACVTFPLTVFGGIVGRQREVRESQGEGPFPCKPNKLAREIPACRWYQSHWMQLLVSGFLPFSAIYIELHYIFNSIWGPRIYTLYGILLLAFVMLLLVAATVTVLFTYFHLNAEDHRWWWRSFGSGVSVAVFFYAYCIYFFLQTGMTGFLQCAFFFLYSLLVAYGLALMMGSVSFYATYHFVTYIYSRIKAE